ncbi:MAG: L-lactate dehydrogenase [Deltaproteobacteria bacterium]|nr:L-lactate dehydrogenase [Deltaproteobacteria bacterium]
MSTQELPSKVAVVGAGLVGSTFAYALAQSHFARQLALVDEHQPGRARGEARDLGHALPFIGSLAIEAGGYEVCQGAHLVVLAAGAAQKPGETRLDLAKKNTAIIQGIVPQVLAAAPDALLLVVANPVDVLTYAAWRTSGLPPERVFGSGTGLDTARFRYELASHCHLDPTNVHGYVLGEHGDSEVMLWSGVRLGGQSLEEYCPVCGRGCGPTVRGTVEERVRRAAYEIIDLKGATNWAIGSALTHLAGVVLRDRHSIVTVSTLVSGRPGWPTAHLSLPVVLGREGVERVWLPPLAPEEEKALAASARVLRETLDSVGL